MDEIRENDKRKKIKKMRKDLKELLIYYFNNIENRESLLKIFNQDVIEYFIKENEKNNEIILNVPQEHQADDHYLLNQSYQNNESQYFEKTNLYNTEINNFFNNCSFNIHLNHDKKLIFDLIIFSDLNNTISYEKFINIINEKKDLNKNYEKFYMFLKEFEKRIIKEYKYHYILKIKLEFFQQKKNNEDGTYNISCFYNFFDPFKKKDLKFTDYNILINSNYQGFESLIKAINNECYKDLIYIEFLNSLIIKGKYIKEFKGYNICWEDEGTIYIYNTTLNKKKGIKFQDNILNIFEIFNDFTRNESQIIIISNNHYIILRINYKSLTYLLIAVDDGPDGLLSSNYNIIFDNDEIFYDETKTIKKFNHSLKINEDLIILFSNSILQIYSKKKKGIIKKIKGCCCFISGHNTLRLMILSNNKILLCLGIKREIYQKNGILLIPNITNKEIENTLFYDTLKFKPYCISLLYKDDNQNNINKKNNTKYFLVGGFDFEECKGEVKLYKVLYYDMKYNIECIQSLDISNNFNNIFNEITCINQSMENGNILILSSSGNLFIYRTLNLRN